MADRQKKVVVVEEEEEEEAEGPLSLLCDELMTQASTRSFQQAGEVLSCPSSSEGAKVLALGALHRALRRQPSRVTAEKLVAVLPAMVVACLPMRGALQGECEEVLRAACLIGRSESAVEALVEFGMEHDSAGVRAASVQAGLWLVEAGLLDETSRAVGKDEDNDDEWYRRLLEGVVGRAGDVHDRVAQAALDALARAFHHAPRRFEAGVRRLGGMYQELIRHHRKRIYGQQQQQQQAKPRGAAAAAAGEDDDKGVRRKGRREASGAGGSSSSRRRDDDDKQQQACKAASPALLRKQAAGQGDEKEEEEGGWREESAAEGKRRDGGEGEEEYEDEAFDEEEDDDGLAFGFVEAKVVSRLTDRSLSSKARFDALALLHQRLQEHRTPGPQDGARAISRFRSQLGPLLQLLQGLVGDVQLKISLRALQVLGVLVEKAGRWLEVFHLDELLPELLGHLGDERIAIRHHAMQVFGKLHRSVGLRLVLARMGQGQSTWAHPRWYVRENALKVLMLGLLACPRDRSRFSTEQLVALIGPRLSDVHGKVKAAALEALALVQQLYLSSSSSSAAPADMVAILKAQHIKLDSMTEAEVWARLRAATAQPLPSLTPDGACMLPQPSHDPTPSSSTTSQPSAAASSSRRRPSDSSSLDGLTMGGGGRSSSPCSSVLTIASASSSLAYSPPKLSMGGQLSRTSGGGGGLDRPSSLQRSSSGGSQQDGTSSDGDASSPLASTSCKRGGSTSRAPASSSSSSHPDDPLLGWTGLVSGGRAAELLSEGGTSSPVPRSLLTGRHSDPTSRAPPSPLLRAASSSLLPSSSAASDSPLLGRPSRPGPQAAEATGGGQGGLLLFESSPSSPSLGSSPSSSPLHHASSAARGGANPHRGVGGGRSGGSVLGPTEASSSSSSSKAPESTTGSWAVSAAHHPSSSSQRQQQDHHQAGGGGRASYVPSWSSSLAADGSGAPPQQKAPSGHQQQQGARPPAVRSDDDDDDDPAPSPQRSPTTKRGGPGTKQHHTEAQDDDEEEELLSSPSRLFSSTIPGAASSYKVTPRGSAGGGSPPLGGARGGSGSSTAPHLTAADFMEGFFSSSPAHRPPAHRPSASGLEGGGCSSPSLLLGLEGSGSGPEDSGPEGGGSVDRSKLVMLKRRHQPSSSSGSSSSSSSSSSKSSGVRRRALSANNALPLQQQQQDGTGGGGGRQGAPPGPPAPSTAGGALSSSTSSSSSPRGGGPLAFLAFQEGGGAPSSPSSSSARPGPNRYHQRSTASQREGEAAAPSSSSSSSSAAPPSCSVALTFEGPSPATSLKGELGFDYLAADDIAPFPDAALPAVTAKTLASLQSADWPEIFHTLNSVRRLSLHHGPVLERHVHGVVRDVLKSVGNLRSAVAKNALLTLGDLWAGLRRAMDGELPVVAPVLLKRFSDTQGFLGEVAESVIDQVIANASDGKALQAFLSSTEHRNPLIRAKAALVVLRCLQRSSSGGGGGLAASGQRDLLERLIRALANLLRDANSEARSAGRSIASLLLSRGLVTTARLERELPPDALHKVLSMRHQQDDGSSSSSSSSRTMGGTSANGRCNSQSQLLSLDCCLQLPSSPHRGAFPNFPARSSSSSSSSSLHRTSGGGGSGSTAEPSRAAAEASGPWRRRSAEEAGEHEEHEEDLYVLGGSTATSVPRGSRPTPDQAHHQQQHPTPKGGAGSKNSSRSSSRSKGRPNGSSKPPSSSSYGREVESVVEGLPALYRGMRSSDWRERRAALGTCFDTVLKYGEELSGCGRLVQAFDHINERLEADGNIKVNLYALERMGPVVESLGPKGLLDGTLAHTLLPAIASSLAASNKQVLQLSQRLMERLVAVVDARSLAGPLCALAEHGASLGTTSSSSKPRVRAYVLQLMAAGPFLDQLHAQRPSALHKQVLPMLCRLLSSPSCPKGGGGELRQASAALLQRCRSVGGGDEALRRGMAPAEWEVVQELFNSSS